MYDVNVISIIYNGDLSTLFHSSGFAYQQRVLKTFPGPDYHHSKYGVVWLYHLLLNLHVYIYTYIYIYIYIYIICVYSKKKVSVYSFNNSFFAFKDIVYKYHGYQKHSDKKNKIKGKNKQITNVKLKVRALQ